MISLKDDFEIDWVTIVCKDMTTFYQTLDQFKARDWLGLAFRESNFSTKSCSYVFKEDNTLGKVYVGIDREYNTEYYFLRFMGESAQILFNNMKKECDFLIDLDLSFTRLDLKYNLGVLTDGEFAKKEDEKRCFEDFLIEQKKFDLQNNRKRKCKFIENDQELTITFNERTNSYFSSFSLKKDCFYYKLEIKKSAAKYINTYVQNFDWKTIDLYLLKCFIKEGGTFVNHNLIALLNFFVEKNKEDTRYRDLYLKNRMTVMKKGVFCKVTKNSSLECGDPQIFRRKKGFTQSFLAFFWIYCDFHRPDLMFLLYDQFLISILEIQKNETTKQLQTYKNVLRDNSVSNLIFSQDFVVSNTLKDYTLALGLENTRTNLDRVRGDFFHMYLYAKDYNITEYGDSWYKNFLTKVEISSVKNSYEYLSCRLHPDLWISRGFVVILYEGSFFSSFQKYMKESTNQEQTPFYSYPFLGAFLLEISEGRSFLHIYRKQFKTGRKNFRKRESSTCFYVLEFLKEKNIVSKWCFGEDYNWVKKIDKETFVDYMINPKTDMQIWLLL